MGNAIDKQKILRCKCFQSLIPDFFHKSQELRICNVAPQRQPYLEIIGAFEIRFRFGLLDALLKDTIHPLPGTLDQATAGKNFGDAAIARILLPENIFRRNPWRQTAGADDF